MLPAAALIPEALGRTAPILDLGAAGLTALLLVPLLLAGAVLGAAATRRAAKHGPGRPGRSVSTRHPVASRAAA